jgi:DNA-binding transcriptional MerR regulator
MTPLDLECTPASTVDNVTYAIAEAAHRSGLSIDTLRYYERIQLIDPPARDSGGRRAYTDEDLAWLEFLTRLRTTGMPIRMMREYARLRHQGNASATRRKQILIEQRAEVLDRIAELNSCLDVLNYKITNYEQCERDLEEKTSVIQEASA